MKIKLNLPTWLTIVRMLLLPVVLVSYILSVTAVPFFLEYGKLIAVVFFVIASFTDFLDGFIARKYNMVTDLGKLLDPMADKMLTTLGFLLVLADPVMIFAFYTWWYPFMIIAVFVALGRDILINGLRQVAAVKGVALAADKVGKLKTVFQIIGLVSFMVLAFAVQYLTKNSIDIWGYTSAAFLGIATILSLVSCVTYSLNFIKQTKPDAIKKS